MKAFNAIALVATAALGGVALGIALASLFANGSASLSTGLPALAGLVAASLAAHALRVGPEAVRPKPRRVRK